MSEWKKKTMKSDPSEIYGVFERLNGLSSCIFFMSETNEKKYNEKGHLALKKGHIFHVDLTS